MTTNDTTKTGVACVGLDAPVKDAIINALVSVMASRIKDIDPADDYCDCSECWTSCSSEGDDWLELDEPFDEYEVSYEYRLTWRYREWTEYWTDPVCYPSFSEMDDEDGEVNSLSIFTPNGESVSDEICNEIIDKVNDLL